MHKSRVASIREQIELESRAMNLALDGYTETARHDIINYKYTQIGVHLKQLKQEVGEKQALELLIDILNQEKL